MAALQTKSAGRTAAINEDLIGILRLKAASPRRAPISVGFATISLGSRLWDIVNPSLLHSGILVMHFGIDRGA
jgi:hypothetical protein